MYDRIYDEEAAKKKEGMPRKLNHLEFLCELIFDLMGWQSEDAELGNDDDAPVSSNTQSASAFTMSSTVASNAFKRAIGGSSTSFSLFGSEVQLQASI